MIAQSNVVVDAQGSSTPFASQEAVQHNRPIDMAGHLFVIKADDNKFLADCLNQKIALESVSPILPELPLPFHTRRQIFILDGVCEVLRSWGEHSLADRIAYFASDEDLEAGDVPLTPESARGFLAFFKAVKSDGRVSLTCSPEGWLCAVWRFPDERRASVWFLDDHRVMFAATDTAGNFVELDNRNEVGDYREVMAKLVQAGLLEWHLDTPISESFSIRTTSPGIALSGVLTKMGFPWKRLFDSENQNLTYLLTGQSISIHQTGNFRLTESSGL